VDHDLHLTGPVVTLVPARTEPGDWPVRRTRMRALGTLLTVAVLVAASGCGRQSDTAGAPEADTCAGKGTTVAHADLDGNGSLEPVRLTGQGSGPCANSLLAPGGTAYDVSGLDLVTDGATVVHLRGEGAPDLVLLSEQPHPRGGYQPHLFGGGGPDGLVEVTADGQPVVPFVATDGGAAPMTATCTKEAGVAVITGTASEPPGVVLAWDLHRTAYDIVDGLAVHPQTSVLQKDVADPLLRKEMPELFDGSVFADCS